MKCRPLEAPFGARVDLDSEGPLTRDEGAALRRLFAEHGLLLIRDREMSPERQVDIVSQLGRVEPDAAGQPLAMEVTNQHTRSSAPDGELVFHYDYAYDPHPIPAISMYGLEVAPGATPTRFASSCRVLSQLPAALLERLAGRKASHACFLHAPESPHERTLEPDVIVPRGQPGWGPEHYWAHHPLIWRNAAGVPTLFACLQHTDRILGMPRDESDALLRDCYRHLYDPGNVYEHHWQPRDLLIWDNLTVQHARPEPNDLPRTLRRFHVSDTNLTEDYLRVGRERGYV